METAFRSLPLLRLGFGSRLFKVLIIHGPGPFGLQEQVLREECYERSGTVFGSRSQLWKKSVSSGPGQFFSFLLAAGASFEGRRVVQYTRTESGRLRYASTRLAGSPMARDLENKPVTRVMS